MIRAKSGGNFPQESNETQNKSSDIKKSQNKVSYRARNYEQNNNI